MATDLDLMLRLHSAAGRQAGALSRDQALALGLGPGALLRLVRNGRWRRLARGVFALSPDSWYQRAWAGLLLAGGPAVLGREAAAFLHGWAGPPERVTVYAGRRVNVTDDRWEFLATRRAGEGEPPRTSVEDTLADLADRRRGG
ncbi:MAG: type IV toxin-antitoxin system AbiEi family antitoxin domain-containing protein [Propionibacteriaceae bacterium]|nr:type IV toxin-antitoxin system AbiEi family antitoxin domain-containing protein [Propionibacteriaceae bacterium]